jgi:uncharacterized protein
MRISDAVASTLKYYVYVYSDPQTHVPFYIGKGNGNRIFSHLNDRSDHEKAKRIQAIKANGQTPQIDILRYGLTNSEANLVEAAAIHLLGKANLANSVAGYHKTSFGRISSEELITMLTAKHVNVRHKAILITINRLYRTEMSPLELYEATRGIWVIGRRREKAEYALAVYQGIVREVYRIQRWHPAGTLKYQSRDASDFKDSGRWEFSGSVEDELRAKYVGRSVGRSGRNPIRYANL